MKKRAPQKTCSCFCALLLTAGWSNGGLASSPGQTAMKGDDISYHLDVRNRRIIQFVEPTDGPVEKRKFVRVEVAKVVNPNRHFVAFEVRYRTGNEKEVNLGGFSLYPADNPGTFIVPTHGKVGSEGAIVLLLVLVDKIEPGDPLQIAIRRIRFVDQ